jgi:hypothetical protein
VSVLRSRFPSVAVADVYNHRTLGDLSARLDGLGELAEIAPPEQLAPRRRWGALQLAGVLALQILISPQWLLAVLAIDRLEGGRIGPQLGWGWPIAGWLLVASIPGRALMLAAARKLMLRRVVAGRFPRHSWLMFRVWLLERLAAAWRVQGLEGTPWAARYARLAGHRVGRGARLFTLPPAASLITIGEDATIEADVDMAGWWIEGDHLVIGEVEVGPRFPARLAARGRDRGWKRKLSRQRRGSSGLERGWRRQSRRRPHDRSPPGRRRNQLVRIPRARAAPAPGRPRSQADHRPAAGGSSSLGARPNWSGSSSRTPSR